MRYLRKWNEINEEVLIEREERKSFTNEIIAIFTDEVIDNFDDIDEIDNTIDIDRSYEGIYYECDQTYLALDLENPYFSIKIHTQSPELLEQIISLLCNFYKKLNDLRFEVEVGYSKSKKITSKDEFFKKLWNHVNYMEDSWSSNTLPFEIKILY